MRLSPHEIAWVVRQTWPDTTTSEQEHAVAVAITESDGDADVIARSADTIPNPSGAPGTVPNPNAGNRDHGLFQLSGRWNYDKIIAAGGDWRDPMVNSTIGHVLFVAAGRRFTPWHVYQSETSGLWLTRLPDAKLAVAHPFPIPARLLRTPDNSNQLAVIQAALDNLQTELDAVNAEVDVVASTGARILAKFA